MTLEQLRVFVVVAETLNMRRSGEILHLTQPAVSTTIASLESRHDTRLFDRIGRGLALSEAGRVFLPEARAVLARADEAQRVLEDLAGLVRGEVRIAASQTVAAYWLPARMARFVEAHPRIDVSLAAGNSARVLALVLAGEADIGFVEGAVAHPQIEVRRVGGDRLGLYAAPGHPLAARPIRAADLRQAVWVLREAGSGTRDHLAAGLQGFGLKIDDLTIRLALPSNGAVLEAVGAGGLIAAVSDLAAAARVTAGLLVRLDCTLPARDFSLITHRARRPGRAALAFCEAVRPPA